MKAAVLIAVLLLLCPQVRTRACNLCLLMIAAGVQRLCTVPLQRSGNVLYSVLLSSFTHMRLCAGHSGLVQPETERWLLARHIWPALRLHLAKLQVAFPLAVRAQVCALLSRARLQPRPALPPWLLRAAGPRRTAAAAPRGAPCTPASDPAAHTARLWRSRPALLLAGC